LQGGYIAVRKPARSVEGGMAKAGVVQAVRIVSEVGLNACYLPQKE